MVTAGWRISVESFFKNNVSFITNLKLRGSLGKIGEDTGDPFQYVEAYSTGGAGFEFANGTWVSGVSAPTVVNRELSWMTSTIKDFGFDLGLFGGQVQVEFDIYQRDREGLLAYRNATLPNTFGASLPQENLNKDRVKGIEFSAAYAFKVNDVAFNVSGNFNFARRMVVYAERGPFVNSMDKWRSGQNERWSDVVWMYDYAGQFQSEEEILNSAIQGGTLGNSREMPGDFRYTDANGDGVIDGNDATPLEWGETPKMFYGLTVGAKWKGFDFYMLWQGAAKYSVMMTHAYATMFWNNSNLPEYFYDRWHRADPYDPNSEWITGEWPANRMQADVGAMYNESSMWRRDASYLRLKSLELGYSFNLKKMGIEELRLFVDGYNLWTICDKYVKPFDPEKVAGNLNTGWVYPLSRSFNFGLSLSF
ncbi:MAG: TonB-dependent receptor [Tannerella sp.]|nr:TonB-dependent receptor [Tannerella sp.]